MRIVLTGSDALRRFGTQVQRASDLAPVEMATALNRVGQAIRKRTASAEARQTGLRLAVLQRAQHAHLARPSDLRFRIEAGGGNISLMHFGAFETPEGESAAPMDARRIFPHAFSMAGSFNLGRVAMPGWRGQVFRRTGRKTSSGKDEFEKVRSGVYLADELVRGATLRTFEAGAAEAATVILGRMAKLFP